MFFLLTLTSRVRIWTYRASSPATPSFWTAVSTSWGRGERQIEGRRAAYTHTHTHTLHPTYHSHFCWCWILLFGLTTDIYTFTHARACTTRTQLRWALRPGFCLLPPPQERRHSPRHRTALTRAHARAHARALPQPLRPVHARAHARAHAQPLPPVGGNAAAGAHAAAAASAGGGGK